MVYLFLAPGFEEVEALTPLDYLRRCDVDVRTVGVGGKTIKGSHGIPIVCDLEDNEVAPAYTDAVILPGGLPGTTNLQKSEIVREVVLYCAQHQLPIAAICAAPSILGQLGLLKGYRATCAYGFEDQLGTACTGEPVEVDGNIITARGAGVAQQFAFALVEKLVSKERAEQLKAAVRW